MNRNVLEDIYLSMLFKHTNFLLREYGIVKLQTEESSVVFDAHTVNFFSVHFTVGKEVLTIEINWNVFLSDSASLSLRALSRRLSLTAECIDVFYSLGFDCDFDKCDTSSVVMTKEYKYPLLDTDIEGMIILFERYLKKASKLLYEEHV